MKKILVLAVLLVFLQVSAKGAEVYNSKCTDLIAEIHKSREALSNVLNLTEDQRKCKRTIDEKFEAEFTANCDVEKEIKNTDEYDKEFRLILTKDQRRKLNDIRKMGKSALKACKKNKVFYKPDENLRPFGMK